MENTKNNMLGIMKSHDMPNHIGVVAEVVITYIDKISMMKGATK